MLKILQIHQQDKSKKHLITGITILLLILFILIASRIWAKIRLTQNTNKQAITIVETVKAKHAIKQHDIVLPGNISAWHEASLYARTNGYIKNWYVDIGYQVKKGELLAQIETPELDEQLHQAEADLNMTIAQNKLAQTTARRWVNLLKSDSVSKQETDEKVDNAKALAASVIANQANRDRLKELVSFERVTAPFSGVISDRATDIGALINAGSNPNAKPLFRLVQTNPLRLYVKIPETYSSRITPNMQVSLQLAEHPGQNFKATLLKTAHALDSATRTLLAEFIVQNKSGELLPGSYATVHFKLESRASSVRLPVNTLLFRRQGLQVATLNQQNQVVLKSITINRDFGNEVEINSGIKKGERVVINPPDSIMNGEQVRTRQQNKGVKKSIY